MWYYFILFLLLLLLAQCGRLACRYVKYAVTASDLHYYGEEASGIPLWKRLRSWAALKARACWGHLSSWRHGCPSAKLKVVGVTGTNGKTTTATVLHELFRLMGHRCGLISTVCIRINDETLPTALTTPRAGDLNRLMAMMVKAGCEYVFMECSSEGLVREHVSGIRFAGGIFTNLTRDHLNYHRTFANYLHAKKSFFGRLPARAFAIVNADDENATDMVGDCKATVKTYSIERAADFMAHIVSSDRHGMCLDIQGREVNVNFIGRHNASNLLAVYAAATMLGKAPDELLAALPTLSSVKGRLECIQAERGFSAFVDYAHTPDALQHVLATLREVAGADGRIITVCGAGGNRDKGKRPLMAQVAAEGSDHVILTSDNPRNEEPQTIIDDMLAGLDDGQKQKVEAIVDRREAIGRACALARPGDVVLVAGKGHENYQEVNGVKHHFDDMEVLRECMQTPAKKR